MNNIKLFALSGSLRKESYNTSVLRAMQMLAPSNVLVVIGDIGRLPLFNPDRENDTIPALEVLKNHLQASSGLIIAAPEYAHGISGPLKNALDWLVSGAEFPNKPLMLINTSPRAFHAQNALREVLVTMSGNIIDSANISIPLLGSDLNADGIIDNADLVVPLRAGLKQFCAAIEQISNDEE